MARIVFAGMDLAVVKDLEAALGPARHEIDLKPITAPFDDFMHADVVFAGGEDQRYKALLDLMRRAPPALAFVVVT